MGTIYWNLVLSITIIRTRLLSFSLPSWPWLPPTNTATRASSMATHLLSLPPSIDPMVNITPLCTLNPLPLPMRFTNTTMRRNMLLVSTPLATTELLTSTMLPFIVTMPTFMVTMPISMLTMPTFMVTMPTFTVTMPIFMVTMVLPTTSTVTPLTMLMLKPTPTSTPTLPSTPKLLSTILPLSTSLLLS